MGILTAVLALAGEHVGVLALGGTVGGALEMALPWITRIHQARKAARIARGARRSLSGQAAAAPERVRGSEGGVV